MTDVQTQKISDITTLDAPERMISGFRDLDVAFGVNREYDANGNELLPSVNTIGLPRGRVTVMAGAGGVGKSRICLSIGFNMSQRAEHFNRTVLYILNEDEPSNIKNWVNVIPNGNEFYVLGSDKIEDHEAAIIKHSPDVVIIDSLTGLDGIESPKVIRDIMKKYKDLASQHECHIILIAHLNKEGDIKGNSDIGYYPDHVCILEHIGKNDIDDFSKSWNIPKTDPKSHQMIADGLRKQGFFKMYFKKSRGTISGSVLYFRHQDYGIKLVSSRIPGWNMR